MSDKSIVRVLQRLYKIVDAGEKGFATAAANMPDPGLKILMKLYAQQRYIFKNEIFADMNRLGVTKRPGASIPGAVHRGRAAIFAGLSSNRESQARMILSEAALGERAAVRSYLRTMEEDLPQETMDLIQRQYADVRKTSELIHCLRVDEKLRSAVRIAASEKDTSQAVQTLIRDGISPEEIETIHLEDRLFYQGRGATLLETVLSGIVGGALWGGLAGLLAGFGVVHTTDLVGSSILLTWLLTVLGFLLLGAGITAVLALFIGASISGEDNFQYPAIRENAHTLVKVRACGVTE